MSWSKPAGAVYNWEVVKANLTEAEKDRILCMYFNGVLTQVDGNKVATDMGSTQNSTKVLLSRTLKKLEKVGAKDGVETTAGSPAKATPKKRKAKDEADETPKSKKGRKGKNDSPVDEDDTENSLEGTEAKGGIKQEAKEDFV